MIIFNHSQVNVEWVSVMHIHVDLDDWFRKTVYAMHGIYENLSIIDEPEDFVEEFSLAPWRHD